ncbi:MAG TPA: hypothetical protein VLX44_06860 [Xanthobacteraceae bacterium]|nr:hypothetical protein [Xanthobacteraceae bacterium]
MTPESVAHPNIADYVVLTFLLTAPILVLAGRMVMDSLSDRKAAESKRAK